jgi:hypothetical protein
MLAKEQSMAENECHAAGQTTYDVHEVLEDAPAAELRFSCDELAEAIDFALDYLLSQDPLREVAVLHIVKRTPEHSEVVWSYRADLAPAEHEDQVRRWGFHPAQTWRLPAARRS